MTASSIVFRADASLHIGTGHVMRCLTLAEELRVNDASCRFICRAHPGNLIDLIRRRGFIVHAMPADPNWQPREIELAHAGWLGADWQTDAQQTKVCVGETAVDWMIVDHYALDVRWESALRRHCGKIMVIDDLADRAHDCNLLLDQSLGRNAQDYAALVPGNCTLLLGAICTLLRPDFSAYRKYSLARRSTPQLKHLLITMGGVDKNDVTGRVLDALHACSLAADCRISVVMGPHAPWLEQVRERAANMPWSTEVLVNISDMARLMADSDLAIGAAGGTSWERCCLGLPSLILVLAENQRKGAQALQAAGAAWCIEASDLDRGLPEMLDAFCEAKTLQRMSVAAAVICNGLGVNHVVSHLSGLPA